MSQADTYQVTIYASGDAHTYSVQHRYVEHPGLDELQSRLTEAEQVFTNLHASSPSITRVDVQYLPAGERRPARPDRTVTFGG